MSTQLLICIRTAPAPTLVTVTGEIDILTAPQLRHQILAIPDGDVVLDFSRVRLLAAAGVRALLALHGHQAQTGARLVLAGPTPVVRRVLAVTGLYRTLVITASAADAATFLATRG